MIYAASCRRGETEDFPAEIFPEEALQQGIGQCQDLPFSAT
jgi:hypothetical protein